MGKKAIELLEVVIWQDLDLEQFKSLEKIKT